MIPKQSILTGLLILNAIVIMINLYFMSALFRETKKIKKENVTEHALVIFLDLFPLICLDFAVGLINLSFLFMLK